MEKSKCFLKDYVHFIHFFFGTFTLGCVVYLWQRKPCGDILFMNKQSQNVSAIILYITDVVAWRHNILVYFWILVWFWCLMEKNQANYVWANFSLSLICRHRVCVRFYFFIFHTYQDKGVITRALALCLLLLGHTWRALFHPSWHHSHPFLFCNFLLGFMFH